MITSIDGVGFSKDKSVAICVVWIGSASTLRRTSNISTFFRANSALYLAAVLNAKWCHSLTCYKVH